VDREAHLDAPTSLRTGLVTGRRPLVR
jgi:hypothetical protein